MPRRGSPAAGAARRLPDRLRRHLDRTGLIRPGDTVTVALSGGLDSVVLLHLLRFGLPDLRLRLGAAHVDHAMRDGSAADALWVRGLCRAWAVPLRVERLEAPPRSEAEARRARYRALRRLAPKGARVATAHHRDDQAETVLFRIARGTGLRGLRGIAPRRGRLVRPLIPFSRRTLEAYAAAAGLAYREDPTNRTLQFARNRLRLVVIPALEAAHPGAGRRLAELAREARRAESAWDAVLARLETEVVLERDEDAVTLARPLLRSYHPHLRARLMRRLLRRQGTTPGRAGTRAALEFISSGSSGGAIHLPGGIRLERDFERFRLTRARPPAEDRPVEIPGSRPGSGRARIGGREWDVAWRPVGGERVGVSGGSVARVGRQGGARVVVPAPAFPLRIRAWRPGDRIRFRYGRKKLKKLLGEHRLDRHARRYTPVLVDAEGAVLWVVGLARAAGVGESGDGLEIVVGDAG